MCRWALLAWQLKGELGLLLGECATQVEIALEERADAGQDGGVSFHRGWCEWKADRRNMTRRTACTVSTGACPSRRCHGLRLLQNTRRFKHPFT